MIKILTTVRNKNMNEFHRLNVVEEMYTLWFHLFEVPKQMKLIIGDGGQNSGGKETGSGYWGAPRILVLFSIYYRDLSVT